VGSSSWAKAGISALNSKNQSVARFAQHGFPSSTCGAARPAPRRPAGLDGGQPVAAAPVICTTTPGRLRPLPVTASRPMGPWSHRCGTWWRARCPDGPAGLPPTEAASPAASASPTRSPIYSASPWRRRRATGAWAWASPNPGDRLGWLQHRHTTEALLEEQSATRSPGAAATFPIKSSTSSLPKAEGRAY